MKQHSFGEFEFDKIFVRDLVLPVMIGLWSEEQKEPQRVRFHVDAYVLQGRAISDEEPVLSYDFIVQAIKDLTNQGHILLVETLAEKIAQRCLSHPAARAVKVCLEKIDRIPGALLGCEIIRQKS